MSLTDFLFEYSLDAGVTWHQPNGDWFPFNMLPEMEEIAEVLLDEEWTPQMRTTMYCGMAPAMTLGFASTTGMAEALEGRGLTTVQFRVKGPDGRVVFRPDPVELEAVDGERTVLNVAQFTSGLGQYADPSGLMTGEIPDEAARIIERVYPLTHELQQGMAGVSVEAIRDLAILTFSAVRAITNVMNDAVADE